MASKLKINRGTTYNITLNYAKNGVATSLVGATVRFTMKTAEFDSSATDSTAAVVKNVTSGDINGQAVISLLPEDTSTLTPQDYFYDIKVEEASGEIYKVAEGIVELDGSPTNRLA